MSTYNHDSTTNPETNESKDVAVNLPEKANAKDTSIEMGSILVSGYVEGLNYINPTLRSVFSDMADEAIKAECDVLGSLDSSIRTK